MENNMKLSVSEIMELADMVNDWCVCNPQATPEETKNAVECMTDLYIQTVNMRYALPRNMVQ